MVRNISKYIPNKVNRNYSKNSIRSLNMQTVKQEVSDLLARLPENCSLEDIQYHLYVLQKIELGLDDAKVGHLHQQDDVEKMMAKWLKK